MRSLILAAAPICALCQTDPFPDVGTTYAAKLLPIKGASPGGVIGSVGITVLNGKAKGSGYAKLLERNIGYSPNDCTEVNGCGVHIHSGSGCEDTEAQGGHFFQDGMEDPWLDVIYPGTSNTGYSEFDFSVQMGRDDVEGRAFVVHANDGSRIACGILSKAFPERAVIPEAAMVDSLKATLHPIEGAKIANVTGFVAVTISDAGVARGAGLAINLEAELDSATDCKALNGCGAHIHEGTGCEDTETQGGHLYASTLEEDPWDAAIYPVTDGLGTAHFEFDVEMGINDAVGKPFILHANDGSRVACGILTPA